MGSFPSYRLYKKSIRLYINGVLQNGGAEVIWMEAMLHGFPGFASVDQVGGRTRLRFLLVYVERIID